jgi:hypothetical protein
MHMRTCCFLWILDFVYYILAMVWLARYRIEVCKSIWVVIPFLQQSSLHHSKSSSLGRHEKYYWFILMPSHNFFSWVSDFRCMQLWYKSNIITNLPPVVGVLHLHAQIQEITITPSNTRVPIPLCSCNSWCTNSEDSNFTWRFKSRTLSCLIIRFGKHCVGEHEGEKRFGEQVFRKPLVGSCEQVGANEDKAK